VGPAFSIQASATTDMADFHHNVFYYYRGAQRSARGGEQQLENTNGRIHQPPDTEIQTKGSTAMNDLAELAKRYDAYEQADRSDFQRHARILQSMWRTEQGYPIGEHVGPNGSRPLGSRLAMPWAKETLANYLNETIRQVVRAEVLDGEASRGKVYMPPRIFDDLLSSQPLCFNLFAELQQNPALATAALHVLAPDRIARVTGIQFEHSPGRGEEGYTDDGSAFDVYVEYRTPLDEVGFAGIEVKYHEDLKDRPACHRPRYDQIAEQMGCFRRECLASLKSKPLQQIWRDHLLAGSMLERGDFEDGFFVFLYPRDNPHCARAASDYQDCLLDRDTFVVWTLEEVTGAIQQCTQAVWIDRFADRYLNFAKIDVELGLTPRAGRGRTG
jgi:hypothetical protein